MASPRKPNSAPNELDQGGNATIREVYEIKDELKDEIVSLKLIVRVGFAVIAALNLAQIVGIDKAAQTIENLSPPAPSAVLVEFLSRLF